jgi:lysophospholipase L1-like esterase
MSSRRITLRPVFKPLVGALIALCVILLLEAVLRVGAFIWHDDGQYYLLYGLHGLVGRVGVTPSITNTGKHYKFPPNYFLRGAAGQAGETAATNSSGFRGPEFQPRKPPGTFRVVCLGESSTFGFHNSDTETYPFLLERLFQEQPSAVRVEVINAGFPYYNSGSITSLLQSEIWNLDPDIITVYSAYNDAGWPLHVGAIGRLVAWLQDHSVGYVFMRDAISTSTFVNRWQRRMSRRLRRGGASLDTRAFDVRASQIVARYRRNYEGILSAARSRDIPVILIKQPMTARFGHLQGTQYSKPYEDEYREVWKKFEENGDLSPVENALLVHYRLVDELEAIAKNEHADLVDNIAIVDRDRKLLMASYVHLTAEGNLRLASALKPVIEKYLPKPPSVDSQSLHNAR